MFRDGQYLEVIKVSDDCLATAVVTVQQKTVEIKRRKVITNKWLQVEDWAALYKILERALLRNGRRLGDDAAHRETRRCEWKKSTRQLEVTYTFDPPESTVGVTLPTIQVHVSPARKKSAKRETSVEGASKGGKTQQQPDSDDDSGDDNAAKRTKEKEEKSPHRTSDDAAAAAAAKAEGGLEKTHEDSRGLKRTHEKVPASSSPKKPKISRPTATTEHECRPKRKRSLMYTLSDDSASSSEELEEYIPDALNATALSPDFKYVPSQKSALEKMRPASNEYTPTLCGERVADADDEITASYVPSNPVKKPGSISYETYEPCATTIIPEGVLEEYVPNSKGIKTSVEEYEPDFKSPSKLMKFDDSYVPSSVRPSAANDTMRTPDNKPERPRKHRVLQDEQRKRTLAKKKIKELFS